MGGKGKTAKKAERHENNALLGGTLEDYFNSQKAYQSGQLKEMSKAMTKHLLTGSGESNAMIMEKEDATAADAKHSVDDSADNADAQCRCGGRVQGRRREAAQDQRL
ncbi:hypothetical protein PINS_up004876 [Pythium insidiosum]|nr:hypothetical protein PINS_up004876 [Pythium insidiosum]